MRYYPVSLDIRGKKCLVVGGGAVGSRKAETLLKCGAFVSVISDAFSETLKRLDNNPKLELLCKGYSESDLDGKFLVIGATDNQSLNKTIGNDAKKKNMLCNIADLPDRCNFILPSIVNRGDLTIAVSTSGKSPAFAKRLRKEMAEQFGEEYAVFLHLMGVIRKKLLDESHDPDHHKILFGTLIQKGLLGLIQQNEINKIDELLRDTLGKGFMYKDLINQ